MYFKYIGIACTSQVSIFYKLRKCSSLFTSVCNILQVHWCSSLFASVHILQSMYMLLVIHRWNGNNNNGISIAEIAELQGTHTLYKVCNGNDSFYAYQV